MILNKIKNGLENSSCINMKHEHLTLNNFVLFLKENMFLVVIVIATLLLSYGFELSNFVLSIDEEVWSVLSQKEMVIAALEDGRWGMAILNVIFPFHKILPFWNDFFSLTGLGLFILLICWIMNAFGGDKLGLLFFAAIFISLPINAYVLMFSTVSTKISVGMIFTILSIIFGLNWTFSGNIKYFFAASILLTLSTGIYQSLCILYVTLIAIIIIINLVKERDINKTIFLKENYKFILRQVCIFIPGTVLYFLIMKLCSFFVLSRGYIAEPITWGKVPVIESLYQIKEALLEFLIPGKLYYGSFILPIAIFIFVIYAVYVFKIFTQKRSIFFLALLALGGSCIAMIVLWGRAVPIRILQSLAVTIPFMLSFPFFCTKNKYIRTVFITTLSVVVLWQSTWINDLYYSDYKRLKQDERIAQDIGMSINKMCIENANQIPVVYLGKYQGTDMTMIIQDERWGESLLHYTGSKGRDRIQMFMQLNGFYHPIATEKDFETASEISDTMPVYPVEGSIIYHNGIFIVKLSE